jgi:plastocyanin
MRMGSSWLALLMAVQGVAVGKEGALEVHVADARGAPVADAIVSLRLRGGGNAPAPAPAPARHTIDQKNLAFVPSLEVVRPGDEVVFRNSDGTRHHVYSFSPAAKFEFVLAPRDSSPPLRLERTGVVAVGCNIHDSMIAWLYVTDAPWTARTGADGRARFDGLPPGDYEVRAWQPRLRPGRGEPTRNATVAADASASVSFALTLLPPPPRTGHDHMQY